MAKDDKYYINSERADGSGIGTLQLDRFEAIRYLMELLSGEKGDQRDKPWTSISIRKASK